MSIVVPAVLSRSLADIHEHLALVRDVARQVQIDVVDGVLAPHATWPYVPGGVEEFSRIVQGEDGLPFWDEFDFEFDCMIAHPEDVVEEYVRVGASRIVIHVAAPGAEAALEKLQPYRTGEYAVAVGVAVSPDTVPADLAPYIGRVDYVQVMGIVHVGAQGQPFDQRASALLAALHAAYPDLALQVDGGVSLEHIHALARAGASRLIVGSALFNAPDIHGMFQELSRAAV